MKGKKGIIRMAIALIGVGALVFVAAFAANGFELKGDAFTRRSYFPDEAFSRVEIQDDIAKVRILPAEDGVCSVTCDEEREGSCTVEISEGVLRIRRERKWYEMIGVHLGQPEVTVLLPQARCDAVDARTSSGEIALEDLEIGALKLKSSSGDFILRNVRADALEVGSTSGTLEALNCTFEGEAELESTSGSVSIADTQANALCVETGSGRIDIAGLQAGSLEAQSVSGGIRLADLDATGSAQIHTTSGDVQLERADAGEFDIRTTSGSIRGSVCSDRLFDVRTNSGSVDIPPSIRDGGAFRAVSTSGDVRITVE